MDNGRYDLESFAVGFRTVTSKEKYEYLMRDVECVKRRTVEGYLIGVCDCDKRILVIGEDNEVRLVEWLLHKAFCSIVQCVFCILIEIFID